MRATIASIINDKRFERFITLLIVFNAVTLGLETSRSIMAEYGGLLHAVDRVLLAIFVAEITARLYVQRLKFFRDPWNVFDFAVVAIALVPASGSLSVLRALRVLRVLRLITLMPSLRRVVGGLIGALPGMGSIMLLMCLIFYVFSVMGTKLFGLTSPEQFGSLGSTAYTLFQVMTFDDWSNGVVKPLLEQHPYAFPFFVVFILLSAFMMLNLFIGVVVSALDDERPPQAPKLFQPGELDPALMSEIRQLREDVSRLRGELAAKAG